MGFAGRTMRDEAAGRPSDAAGPGSTTINTSLLIRLKGRDPEAWRRLVALYGPEVYRWARRAGLSAEDAADVGQEVFRAVAERIDDFRRERPGDTFGGWLRGITLNKVRDHWRRRGGEPAAEGGTDGWGRLARLPDDADPIDPGPPGQLTELLRRALGLIRDDFEDRTWRAFWMVVAEGRTPAAVAEELGMSRRAVYVAKSRVLGRLRAEFQDLLE